MFIRRFLIIPPQRVLNLVITKTKKKNRINHLDRTPALPRAENWPEAAGIGGFSELLELENSELPFERDPSLLAALFEVYSGVPF